MSDRATGSFRDPSPAPLTRGARNFSILLIVALVAVAWLARDALAPFIIAVLVIYMLLPIVHWIERILPSGGMVGRFARPIAALGASVVAIVALVLLIGTLMNPIVDETQEMLDSFGAYWEQIKADNPDFATWYEDHVPDDIQAWLDTHIKEIGKDLLAGIASVASWLLKATGSTIATVLALVSIPLFIVYYLIDEKSTAKTLRAQFPLAWSEDAIAVFRIFDRIFGAYTRGVILEAGIVGVITGFGYWVIGVDLFLPLGVVACVGEIVPIVGPWLAFFVSFPVVLATQPDRAIPAMLLFLVIQMLEGWFLAPQIQGNSNDFTNSGTLLILAIGSALGGALGMILALPVAGLARALSVYIYHRLEGVPPAGALSRLKVFQDRETGAPHGPPGVSGELSAPAASD